MVIAEEGVGGQALYGVKGVEVDDNDLCAKIYLDIEG